MKIYDDITKFIFVNDTVQKSDVIMIVGGIFEETAINAARLYNDGFADCVLASGKYSAKTGEFVPYDEKCFEKYGKCETESEFHRKILIANGVPDGKIICENESQYTYENAAMAKDVLSGKKNKKAVLCVQSFHARRALMYYQLSFPNVKFFVAPSDTQNITRHNWFKSRHGIDMVLGELERIGKQFKDKINY